jgi:hypothetical protein
MEKTVGSTSERYWRKSKFGRKERREYKNVTTNGSKKNSGKTERKGLLHWSTENRCQDDFQKGVALREMIIGKS